MFWNPHTMRYHCIDIEWTLYPEQISSMVIKIPDSKLITMSTEMATVYVSKSLSFPVYLTKWHIFVFTQERTL